MTIQKTIIALLLAIPLVSKSESLPFTIQGKILNPGNLRVLHIIGPGINDTVKLQADGAFNYSGQLVNPSTIFIQGENIYNCMIWADKGLINLTLEVAEVTSQNQKPYKHLVIKSVTGPLETEMNQSLTNIQNEIAVKHQSVTTAARDTALREFFPIFTQYVEAHPSSPLLADLLLVYNFPLAEKKALFSLLQFNEVNSDNMDMKKVLTNQIAQLEQFQTGNKIQDFEQADSSGKNVNLYTIKNKFILLKFWASNCGPCRAENPRLVKLYSQYHTKGLEIVGISLDNSKADWVKALDKDQTPWINISDLNGLESDFAKRFNLYVIPFSILVDENYAVVKLNPLLEDIKEILEKDSVN